MDDWTWSDDGRQGRLEVGDVSATVRRAPEGLGWSVAAYDRTEGDWLVGSYVDRGAAVEAVEAWIRDAGVDCE